MREAVVKITIRAVNATKGVLLGLERQMQSFGAKLKGAFTGVQGALAGLGLALGSGALIQFLAKANIQFQQLQARLQTFTGSAEGAAEAFEQLAKFAATTPFELSDSVEAFITLRSAGIDPTTETLRRLGDQASAFGGNIRDMAEAVRAASTGEMERLKRFGVVARLEGDKIIANFQGQSTEIERSAVGITNYLENLSKQKFAGSMEREMATLGGAISNLKDSLFQLATSVGEAGASGAMARIIRGITEFSETLRNNGPRVQYWTNLVLTAVSSVVTAVKGAVKAAWNLGQGFGFAIRSLATVLVTAVEVVLQAIFVRFNGAIELLNKLPGVEIDFRFPDLTDTINTNLQHISELEDKAGEALAGVGDGLTDIGLGVLQLGEAVFTTFEETTAGAKKAAGGMDEFGLAADSALKRVNEQMAKLHLPELKSTSVAELTAASERLTAVINQGKLSGESLARVHQALAVVQGVLADKTKAAGEASQAAAKAEEERLKLLLTALKYGSTRAQAMVQLVGLEAALTLRLREGNIPLAERVALEERLAAIREGTGLSSQPVLAGSGPEGRSVNDEGRDLQSGQLQLRTGGAAQAVLAPQASDEEIAAERWANAYETALEPLLAFNDALYQQFTTAGLLGPKIGGTTDAILGMTEAIADSIPGHGAAAKAAEVAAKAVAKVKGGIAIAEGGVKIAQSLFPPNPAGLASGAGMVTQGLKLLQLGGGSGGGYSGRGGGGGGGRAQAERDAEDYRRKTEAARTIYVQGGLLDMSDPRQAEALSDALSTLGNEGRIEIVGG